MPLEYISFLFFFSPVQSSALDDRTVLVFGSHLTDSDKSTLITVDQNLEETIIATTPFRHYCALACLNGESDVT